MKKKTKRKHLAEGVYDQNGRIVIAYRKDGKLIWDSPGLPVTRANVQKAVERRAELKFAEKERVIKADVSMREYADIYLKRRQREISETTYSKYFYRVKHITAFFRDTQIRKITSKKTEEFYDRLFTEHQLDPKSVKEIRRHLILIMDMAVEDMIIVVNPTKTTKINKVLADKYSVKKDKGETFFSYEEAKEFLKCCDNHRLKDFFAIMLFYGLRREETLGIRIKGGINLEKKTLTINHTVTVSKNGIIRQDTVKSGTSESSFPIPDPQMQIFQKLINEKKRNKKLFGSQYIDTDYLFVMPDGEPYKPDYVTKQFKKIIRKNPQLPQDITLEGLRPSCASILVHAGENIKSVQAWLRHKEIETTLDIYARSKGMREKTELAKSFNQMLKL